MWCGVNIGAIIAVIAIVLFFLIFWIVRRRRNAENEEHGGWYSIGARSLVSSLTGSQVVPPLKTNVSGSFAGQLYPNTRQLNYLVEVVGLPLDTVTSIQLHQGFDGENGPIIKTLYSRDLATCLRNNINVDEKSNSWSIYNQWSSSHGDNQSFTTEVINAMLSGNVYVAVYTDCEQQGLIRGQIELVNSSLIYKF
jgi:hypothetical protein